LGKYALSKNTSINELRQEVENDYAKLTDKKVPGLKPSDIAYNLARSLFRLLLAQHPEPDDLKTIQPYLFYLSMIVGQIAKQYKDDKDMSVTIEFQEEIQSFLNPNMHLSHYSPIECSEHHQIPLHRESHARLNAVRETLNTMHIMQALQAKKTMDVFSWPHYQPACQASMQALLKQKVTKASETFSGSPNLNDNDLPVKADTYLAVNAALNAAQNAAVRVLNNIQHNKDEKIFCAIRPPGHHGGPEQPEGFCFANSMIQAASTLMCAGKKVLIIDFDAHHGNGTYAHLKELAGEQQNLYRMVDVFADESYMDKKYMRDRLKEATQKPYCDKIHLHPLPSSEYTGENVLNKIKTSVEAFAQQGFTPDVILVSAGFDAAKVEDYNGNLLPHDFGKIGEYIGSCCPHVISLLEGGYCHQEHYQNSLQQSVFHYIAGTANLLMPSNAPYPLGNLTSAQTALKYLYGSYIKNRQSDDPHSASDSSSSSYKKRKMELSQA
jgi:acetoin utilization deacetylase AcuC-like enzyme